MQNTTGREGTNARLLQLQLSLLAASCALALPAIAEHRDIVELIVECQQLDDDALRHDCFDALPDLRRDQGEENSSTRSVRAIEGMRVQAADGVTDAPEEPESRYPMTATIVEVDRTRDDRLVLRLDNDTRWIEDKASQIGIREGTTVIIHERGAFGGRFWKHYEMRAGNHDIKVVPLR